MKKVLTGIIKIIAFIVSSIILLSCLFDFQYSLLTGPFMDVLIFIGLMIIGLIFSIALIPMNGIKKVTSYLPLTLIIVALSTSFLIPNNSFGHKLHYHQNSKNLELIDRLSQEASIFEITDMLRYQKRLNTKSISNDQEYTTQEEIDNVFGDYITTENLNIEQICKLRKRLEDSNIISLLKTDDYLILTVDGFVDNEYGYVKTTTRNLKVGETLPPYGFIIVRLIEFKNGWYFVYTS